jgi:hypothetical protein
MSCELAEGQGLSLTLMEQFDEAYWTIKKEMCESGLEGHRVQLNPEAAAGGVFLIRECDR